MLYSNVLEAIGNTPLVLLKQSKDRKYKLWGKLESLNPSGSIKARIANYIIDNALKNKIINKKTTIIEATSGNTGIGLAMVCAVKNLKLIITMPSNMSKERIDILKAYGAKVILTNEKLGMSGAKIKAKELLEKYSNSYMPSQFENKYNVLTHYYSTGEEIIRDLSEVDCLVSGIGTAGTIMGVSKRIKEFKDIYIVGVEPLSSPLITNGKSASHKIQGIGANFIPPLLNKNEIDEMQVISDDDAITYTKKLARKHGMLLGISSGAAYKAALNIYDKKKFHNIVVIFPDDGQKYLSLNIY